MTWGRVLGRFRSKWGFLIGGLVGFAIVSVRLAYGGIEHAIDNQHAAAATTAAATQQADRNVLAGFVAANVPRLMRARVVSSGCQFSDYAGGAYLAQCGQLQFIVSLNPPGVRPANTTTARSWDLAQ